MFPLILGLDLFMMLKFEPQFEQNALSSSPPESVSLSSKILIYSEPDSILYCYFYVSRAYERPNQRRTSLL